MVVVVVLVEICSANAGDDAIVQWVSCYSSGRGCGRCCCCCCCGVVVVVLVMQICSANAGDDAIVRWADAKEGGQAVQLNWIELLSEKGSAPAEFKPTTNLVHCCTLSLC